LTNFEMTQNGKLSDSATGKDGMESCSSRRELFDLFDSKSSSVTGPQSTNASHV
jgi:hypothetical protein